MTLHKLDTKVYVGQKAFVKKDGKVLVLRDPMAMVEGQSGLETSQVANTGGAKAWKVA